MVTRRYFPAFTASAALWLCPLANVAAQVVVDAAALVRSTSRAVVLIRTFDSRGEELGLGSGFVISGGRIVTNAHVVAGAARAEIHDSENRLLGVVDHAVALSTRIDIAVLPQLATAPTPLSLALTEPAVGTRVYAFGAPLGLSNTISDGIVSSFRELSGVRRMQITAPIASGSSGGPIVDEQGRVVGVSVSSLSSGQNLNFAVPADEVRAIIASPPGRYAFTSAQDQARGVGTPIPSPRPAVTTLRLDAPVVGRLEQNELTDDGVHQALFAFDGQRGQSITIRVVSSVDTKATLAYLDESGTARTIAEDDDSGGDLNPRITVVLPETRRYHILVSAYERGQSGDFRLTLAETDSRSVANRDPRWVDAGGNDDILAYADSTSIRNNRGLVTGWIRWEYNEPQRVSWATFDEQMQRREVNCAMRRSRTLEAIYRLEGRVTDRSESATSWRADTPGSVGERMSTTMCRLAGLRY